MAYDLKTKENDESVSRFIESIENDKRREECLIVLDVMEKASGHKPKMWGKSIVGFGKYSYKTKSKIEGEWFIVGFSPRKQNLTLYIIPHVEEQEDLIKKMGKVKTAKSCIYVNKIEDIDLKVLKELIISAFKSAKTTLNLS